MPSGAKPKVYPDTVVASVRHLYCEHGMTQVEVARALDLSPKVVWNLMRRHGIERRKAVKRDQRGERNDSWRGGRSRNAQGYAMLYRPGHHRASSNGYVFEHIVIAEAKVGRPLRWFGTGDPRSEVVHHIDGNNTNNDPANLSITTYAGHANEHRDPATGRLREVIAGV